MDKLKPIRINFASHFKLSLIRVLHKEKKKDMQKVPHALIVYSLMYMMVAHIRI